MKENVRNFASTTLAASMSFADSSFTVATGTGAAFPSVDSTHPQRFVVAVDTELILCSQRTGDTFTVAQRGFDGTVASSHASGASVTHAMTAGMMDHLWSNVGDAFNMSVPPFARGGSAPSAWDDEFESNSGAWTIFPTPPNTGSSDWLDFGVVKSCMRFQRADLSNIIYHVYKPFTPGDTNTAFTVTAKMSHGARIWGQDPNTVPPFVELSMFVSDQSSISSYDQGNIARVDHSVRGYQVTLADPVSGTLTVKMPVLKSAVVNNSTYQSIDFVPADGNQYVRLYYNGSGTYLFYVGDGMTWTGIGRAAKRINVATVGFRFLVLNASNTRTEQNVLVDWLRVTTGVPAWTNKYL